MGTFRTYTVKVSGNDITFKDLTIENNAAPLGQAVALHTEGDRLMFINCRFLGNQDTIYTGSEGARLLFTLSSDLPLHFSNTVSCIANVIRISLPLLLLKI